MSDRFIVIGGGARHSKTEFMQDYAVLAESKPELPMPPVELPANPTFEFVSREGTYRVRRWTNYANPKCNYLQGCNCAIVRSVMLVGLEHRSVGAVHKHDGHYLAVQAWDDGRLEMFASGDVETATGKLIDWYDEHLQAQRLKGEAK